MKFSKILILSIIFVSGIINSYAQKNIEFIEDEVQKIENILFQKDKSSMLTNEQKSGLYVILEDKYKKINSLNHTGQDKYGIHTALVKINKEFDPRIASLLNPTQRIAYNESIK